MYGKMSSIIYDVDHPECPHCTNDCPSMIEHLVAKKFEVARFYCVSCGREFEIAVSNLAEKT